MKQPQEITSNRVLTVPNAISAGRLLLVPVFFWLFVGRINDSAAFIILAIIGTTDWVDGFLARRLGQVSALGKVLDPVADRVAVIAVVVALLFRGTIPPAAAAVILLRDLIVSIVFPILEARGYPRIPVNFVGKAATFAIYSAVGLAVFGLIVSPTLPISEISTFILWIGAALYWVAGYLYLRTLIALARARRSAA